MKKIMVLAMAVLVATVASAAQCAGMTKKGERCKREAAEGSQYCLGHADQAKTAKLKDDGTCWAVTEAGTRCKHKKNGESDYCKQHGPDVKAKTPGGQCRALKWTDTSTASSIASWARIQLVPSRTRRRRSLLPRRSAKSRPPRSNRRR